MRDLNQRQPEPKAKANPRIPRTIQSPWYSPAWHNLTRDFVKHPFCSESHATYRFEEKSIRTAIEEIRAAQLQTFLPAAMRRAIGPAKKECRRDYQNPKPYEKINARVAVFGSRLPTQVPEKFALVIYFFSAESDRPIASYTEEVHCVFH